MCCDFNIGKNFEQKRKDCHTECNIIINGSYSPKANELDELFSDKIK